MLYVSPFDYVICVHVKRGLFGGLKNQSEHTCKNAGSDKCMTCVHNKYINPYLPNAKQSFYLKKEGLNI